MPRRYPECLLRALRNEIPVESLLADVLQIPWKFSEGYFRFLCPLCAEFHTATNPRTNLARCFRCQRNFNPIDLVILERGVSFTEAVEFLLELRCSRASLRSQARGRSLTPPCAPPQGPGVLAKPGGHGRLPTSQPPPGPEAHGDVGGVDHGSPSSGEAPRPPRPNSSKAFPRKKF